VITAFKPLLHTSVQGLPQQLLFLIDDNPISIDIQLLNNMKPSKTGWMWSCGSHLDAEPGTA